MLNESSVGDDLAPPVAPQYQSVPCVVCATFCPSNTKPHRRQEYRFRAPQYRSYCSRRFRRAYAPASASIYLHAAIAATAPSPTAVVT